MDQSICACLSHTHCWYKVGMLKVLAYILLETLKYLISSVNNLITNKQKPLIDIYITQIERVSSATNIGKFFFL